jgi:Histidine kinase-like ATPase domain
MALPPAASGPPRDHRDDPGTYVRVELDPAPAAVARSRRLARDTLVRWDMPHLADDAQIIASELSTNAVSHAIPSRAALPAIIFAVHRRLGELRVIVWDNGPGHPARTDASPDAETGRGLAIVDALSGHKCGWWPTPISGGKVVGQPSPSRPTTRAAIGATGHAYPAVTPPPTAATKPNC